MCAGIIPSSVLDQFGTLGLMVPDDLVVSRITGYTLHTPAGAISAHQPDEHARIISVYRGAGPRCGDAAGWPSFDDFLLRAAVVRGARLRRCYVETIRRGKPVEVLSEGRTEPYDLVVLATGVNGRGPRLEGFGYRPPRTEAMWQTELHLGREEVERRLGSAVHVFLLPDEIAAFGILVPKGPNVSASLLQPCPYMRDLPSFLEREEVAAVLGAKRRPVCGCRPRVSVGPASEMADDGFVAIGDAAATRLYKNGIGSALKTADRAARTAIYHGCSKAAFERHYVPLCRAIGRDNRLGRLLFLELPLL
jgi:flavin-dependent dehydrogenase